MTIPIKVISKKEFLEKNGKPSQEEIWDSIANAWNKYVVKKIPIVEDFLKGKNGKVVDLGCGDGRNMIANDNIEYWGVDFSSASLEHVLKRVKKEGLNVKTFRSGMDKLPKEFEDEMFDSGLLIASLHCLESEKEREKSLKEFYRILKKGGEGLISVWDSSDKRFDGVGNHGDVYMSWRDKGVSYMRYYYLYSKEELLGLLESVGFKVVEIYSSEEHDRFSKKNLIVRVKK